MTVAADTEVVGLDVEHGAIRPGHHRPPGTSGRPRRDRLRLLEPAHRRDGGARDPAEPAVPPDVDIGPVERFADAGRWWILRIVRDIDTNMYERQDGVGSRSAPMRTRRSSSTPTRSPPSRSRRSAPPSSRSPRPTSTCDRAGARADARDRRRRVRRRALCHQRPAGGDPRRPAAARRDHRGHGAVDAATIGSRRARAGRDRGGTDGPRRDPR